MFHSLKNQRTLLATSAALFAIAPAVALAATPGITAKPNELMVNGKTTLTGRHFPADTEITLSECGKKFWLAPADPCLHEHDQTVTTNSNGRFRTTFTVGVCPESENTGPITQRICYIGELRYGEDTGELLAPAKVLVSYP